MNINRKFVLAGIAALGLLLIALPASAGVVDTFTVRSEWEAISATRTDINFDSLNLNVGESENFSTSSGVTEGGVTITGVTSTGYFLWAGNPPLNATDDFGSGTRLRGPEYSTTSYLLMTLPSDVFAFGLDMATMNEYGESFRIELDGIDLGIIITTQQAKVLNFFGVQTDSAISQVRIYQASGTSGFTVGFYDNVSYMLGSQIGGGGEAGTGAETPEVATLVAVGSGLLFLGWRRRRMAVAAAV